MIGPLLLIYNRLVIYGPVFSFIQHCYNSEEYHNTALSPKEFIQAIEDNRIVPLGFESFFDAHQRQDFASPALRITSDFDEDLTKSTTILGKKVFKIPDRFKFETSSPFAIQLIEQDLKLKNRILSTLSMNAPDRYKDFLENQSLLPEALKQKLSHISNQQDLLPYLAVYDLLSNRYVMKRHGLTNLHVQFFDYKDLYKEIHGLSDPEIQDGNDANDIVLSSSEISSLIKSAIQTCCQKSEYHSRLTYEKIEQFRLHYRDTFIEFLKSIILKVQSISDASGRQEEFTRLLEKNYLQ
ncbi:MAG: hypothetical protein OEV87_06145 [Phycisphaerae bacterium]|nr:hypothetical protein [Phycisphaerae bacterium]